MNNIKATTALIILAFAQVAGYIINVVWLVRHADSLTLTGSIILRLVGLILAPLGALMGYFG